MITAVHYVTGAWIDPKPDTKLRDRSGCFIGCRYYGCQTTRCRELVASDPECRQREWIWKAF